MPTGGRDRQKDQNWSRSAVGRQPGGRGVGDRQRAQGCGRETDRGLAREADRGCKREVGRQTGG